MPYDRTKSNRAYLLYLNPHWMIVHKLFLILNTILKLSFCSYNCIEEECEAQRGEATWLGKVENKQIHLGPKPGLLLLGHVILIL